MSIKLTLTALGYQAPERSSASSTSRALSVMVPAARTGLLLSRDRSLSSCLETQLMPDPIESATKHQGAMDACTCCPPRQGAVTTFKSRLA